jgi:hypothetical protein
MGKPMSSVVDLMVRLVLSIPNPAKVCLACKDKSKCELCVFRRGWPSSRIPPVTHRGYFRANHAKGPVLEDDPGFSGL